MLELTLKRPLDQHIDGSQLSPQKLLHIPLAELMSLPLRTSRSGSVRLEDLFWVQWPNVPSDMVMIRGDCSLVAGLGHQMSSGALVIDGNAGDRIAEGMRGGVILVAGNAGEDACAGMRGGIVAVNGNCGDRLATPLPGERSGMRGGDILIAGNVGDRACQRMRRGTVCIAGNAGKYLAPHMIAGTILVLGKTAAQWGMGMQRGSLLFASHPEGETGASLSPCRHLELSFLPLVWNHLRSVQQHLVSLCAPLQRMPWRSFAIPSTRWVERRIGDVSAGGQGEVLVLQRLSSIASSGDHISSESTSPAP